jgi:hypothetical protein
MARFIQKKVDGQAYWYDPQSGMVLLSERGYAKFIGVQVVHIQMLRRAIIYKGMLEEPHRFLAGDIADIRRNYRDVMQKLGLVDGKGEPHFPMYLMPLIGTQFYLVNSEDLSAKSNIYLIPDITMSSYNTYFASSHKVSPAESVRLIGMLQAISLRTMLQELIGVKSSRSFQKDGSWNQVREQHREGYGSTTRLLHNLGWSPNQVRNLTRSVYREQLGMSTIQFRRLHNLPSEARIVDNLPSEHITIRNVTLKKQSQVLPLIEGHEDQKEVALRISRDVTAAITKIFEGDISKYLE